MIGEESFAEILYPQVEDPRVWHRLQQVSKRFNRVGKRLLIKNTKDATTWTIMPNGQLHGLYRKWLKISGPDRTWCKGGLTLEENYHRGKKHGYTRQWDAAGFLLSEHLFNHGLLQFTKTYYIMSKQVQYECEYKNNLEHGLIKSWYSNGQLEYTVNYQNGDRNGEYKEWYLNGQLYLVRGYLNGKKHGVETIFYSSEKPVRETHYKNGKRNGSCKEWAEDFLITEETYINGEKNGICKIWYPNGQLRNEMNYENDIGHGLCKRWYPNGQLKSETTYNYGKKIHSKIWKEDGTEHVTDQKCQKISWNGKQDF